MSEGRYVSPDQRAAWLIDKGTRAWQEIQRLAMSEHEPFDAVVLLGQELWLPHHETNGRLFRVTLRIGVHYPEHGREAAEALVAECVRELCEELSDDTGELRIDTAGIAG